MNPIFQLCEAIEHKQQELHVPGIAAGVWFQGQVQTAAFGVTSTVNPLAVTPQTLFQVGSISKTMLATSMMRLVEQGRVTLDDPVRTYLPGLRLADEKTAAGLTLRHLLTHTGGWAGDYFNNFGWGDDALEKMVASLVQLPQLTPLGSCWHYNNAGFAIAGRVIEVVTGLTYEFAIIELLFNPLGMDRAFFFPEDIMVQRFAVGHFTSPDKPPVIALPWAVGRATHPAGGVVADIPNLLRYARFHLGDGRNENGERLLQSESLAEMRRSQAYPGVSADAMGLTWFIKQVGDVSIYRHGGATHGQNAQFLFVPQRQFAFAILSNADHGGTLCTAIAQTALELFLGITEPQPDTYTRPDDELIEYAGAYDAQAQTIELILHDGGLRLQIYDKGGFPTPESPPQPDPEPSPAAFIAPDRILITAGLDKGTRAEFLRDEQGRIEWLRISGRIHRKLV